jgi:ankyrin repeat protein
MAAVLAGAGESASAAAAASLAASEIVAALARAGSPHLDTPSDDDGLSPLLSAARLGRADVARQLLLHGCRVNARAGAYVAGTATTTPLFSSSSSSASSSSSETQKEEEERLTLRERRERRDAASLIRNGYTALHVALEKRRAAVVDYLLFHADRERAEAALELSQNRSVACTASVRLSVLDVADLSMFGRQTR